MRLCDVDAKRWTAARQHLPGAAAFHRQDFLQLAAQALDGDLRLLADVDGGALVPLLMRRRAAWWSVNWVPFPYLGPLARPGRWTETAEALDADLAELRLGIAKVSLSTAEPEAVAAFAARGWRVYLDTTMVVKLGGASEEQLLDTMSRSARREIRGATESGLSVRAATREDVTVHLPRLVEAVFARQGMASDWPARQTAELAWPLIERGDGWRATATVDSEGATQAVAVVLEDGDAHYLWWGGAARHECPFAQAATYWELIRHGLRSGAARLDLVGAPNQGIRTFKARFGARPEPFLVAERIGSRTYLAAQRAHGRLLRRRHGRQASRA
jgi:hypothetical protein